MLNKLSKIESFCEYKYAGTPHENKFIVGEVQNDLSITYDNGMFLYAVPMLNNEIPLPKRNIEQLKRHIIGKKVVVAPLLRGDFGEEVWNRYYKNVVGFEDFNRVRVDWKPYDNIHSYYCYRIAYVLRKDKVIRAENYASLNPFLNIFMSESYYLTSYLNLL